MSKKPKVPLDEALTNLDAAGTPMRPEIAELLRELAVKEAIPDGEAYLCWRLMRGPDGKFQAPIPDLVFRDEASALRHVKGMKIWCRGFYTKVTIGADTPKIGPDSLY